MYKYAQYMYTYLLSQSLYVHEHVNINTCSHSIVPYTCTDIITCFVTVMFEVYQQQLVPEDVPTHQYLTDLVIV